MVKVPPPPGAMAHAAMARDSIYALGSGEPARREFASGEQAGSPTAERDPRDFLAPDDIERVRLEEARRWAVMLRRRAAQEEAGACDVQPAEEREACCEKRALSYAGSQARLASLLRHHEAEQQGKGGIKFAASRAALCAAILDGNEEDIEAAKQKLANAKRKATHAARKRALAARRREAEAEENSRAQEAARASSSDSDIQPGLSLTPRQELPTATHVWDDSLLEQGCNPTAPSSGEPGSPRGFAGRPALRSPREMYDLHASANAQAKPPPKSAAEGHMTAAASMVAAMAGGDGPDGNGGGGVGSNLDVCGAQAVPRHQRPGQREIRLAEEDAAASVDSEPWKPKSTFVHHKRGARAGDRWAPGFSGTGAATAAANAAAARLQKLQQLRDRVGVAVKVCSPFFLFFFFFLRARFC